MQSKNKGIFYIICSAFFFALMSLSVRLAGDLPAMQKSFFRNFIAMIFAFLMLKKNHASMKIEREQIVPLLLRSTFGTIGILCNFYAVDHLLLADASILNKLSPFFAILFSFLLLKEKMKPFPLACVIVAFVGSLFVIKPGIGAISSIPAIVGILGGMFAGMAYTYVRLLGTLNMKGPFIVFFFSAFSCFVTVPYLILNYHPMTMQQVVTLLFAGLFACGGQFSITAAYQHAAARDISIYDYSQIIFSTLLGFIFFGQIPDLLSFTGYFIIIMASVVMFIYNQKH